MRLALVTIAVLSIAACASPEPPRAGAGAQASGVAGSSTQVAQVCTREAPIGSNIPVTRCAPVADGQSVRQMVDNLPKIGGSPKNASALSEH